MILQNQLYFGEPFATEHFVLRTAQIVTLDPVNAHVWRGCLVLHSALVLQPLFGSHQLRAVNLVQLMTILSVQANISMLVALKEYRRGHSSCFPPRVFDRQVSWC